MDTITHIVIGAAQGELLAGKKIGKRAMLWGAVANLLPDMDVVLSPFLHAADNMLAHRGFTHSILFASMLPFLLGYLFSRWYQSKGISAMRWTGIFALGMFTHIFIDALNTYGTGWFEPFSHYRVSFNTIFVADPFLAFPLIISFVALLILKRDSPARKSWNIWGILLSSIYLVFTFYNKYEVNNIVRENLDKQDFAYSDYITTPAPLNNFLWYALVKDGDRFHAGYYSIFDSSRTMSFYTIPSNDSLLDKYRNEREVQKLIRFSQGYYAVTKSDTGEINFHDLRFGQAGGWTNPAADFVFSYHLKKDADNRTVIQGGRFKGAGMEAVNDLIERIKGR